MQPGEPLLQTIMRLGRRVGPTVSLREMCERTLANLSRLPDELRTLAPAPPYGVTISQAIRNLADLIDRRTGATS